MTGLTRLVLGRGGGIRTRDPLHPMQVRYQAVLRPDKPPLYRSFGVLGRDSEDFCNLQKFAAESFRRKR